MIFYNTDVVIIAYFYIKCNIFYFKYRIFCISLILSNIRLVDI